MKEPICCVQVFLRCDVTNRAKSSKATQGRGSQDSPAHLLALRRDQAEPQALKALGIHLHFSEYLMTTYFVPGTKQTKPLALWSLPPLA